MVEKGFEQEATSSESSFEEYPFWLKPPFRLLTDITQFRKVDPWDLEIADLITRFVEKMKMSDDVNFPVLGRAILSASILYRSKVGDLVKIIEENDQIEEDLEALKFEIPEISQSYHISQRPVTFKELVYAFQGLLKQEERYRQRVLTNKRKALVKPLEIPVKPVQIIEEESTKIAKIKKETYELLVKLYAKYNRPILFEELIPPNTSRTNIVRIFLCTLFLGFEVKAKLYQDEDLGRISLEPIRDNEEEFLGGLEKVIEKKLQEGPDEEGGVTVTEVDEEEDLVPDENEEYLEYLEEMSEEEFQDMFPTDISESNGEESSVEESNEKLADEEEYWED